MLPSRGRTRWVSLGLAGILDASPNGLRRFDPQTVTTIVALLLALLLGITIVQGNWLLVAAIAVVPLILLRPVEVSLGAFALLVPFDSIATVSGQKTGTTLTWFIGAATAVILLFVGVAGDRMDKPRRDTVAWALFIGWGAMTTLWALDQTRALERLLTAISLFLVYFAATCLRIKKKELTWILLCTIFGGLVAALYSIYSYYHGVVFVGARSSLIMGDRTTDPNGFATNLLLPFSLAFGMFLAARRGFVKTVMLAAVATILFAIILTMSRGGLVSVVAIVLIYVYRLRLKLRLLFPVAAGALLLLAAPSLYFQRILEAGQTGGAGRTDLWMVGLVAIKSYGIFGAGLSNFPVVFNRFAGYAPHFRGFDRVAHNIYLSAFVELGIVGIILLLNAFRTGLWGRQFTKATSPFHSAVACEAACWGMVAGGFFLDILWTKAFWLVWILLAVVTRLQESPTEVST